MRRALLVLCAIGGLGLALGASWASPRYAFSHLEHSARDPQLKCVECHDLSRTVTAAAPNRGAPMLRTARCEQCHDEVPQLLPREGGATLAVSFDHRPHAAAIEGRCTDCHELMAVDGMDDKRVEHRLKTRSAMCFACHAGSADAPREQSCARCHGSDQRRVQPASHAASWRRSHGAGAMPFAPVPHGQSCTLCHQESTCKSCHRVEAPADHTLVWAQRTHGIAASFEGARCKTCHETGGCISCHQSTMPRNHMGAWKSTHGLVANSQSDVTCKTCHRPSFCIDCHRGGR